jgi:ubiquinol-cytochrome c reductase cytochrome b subunit
MAERTGALRSVIGWLEERTGLGQALTPVAAHPVPARTASWWYVFGSATLAAFALQIATGICLALVYVPAADQAYQSLRYLNDQAAFGWYLRAVHFWGSNLMVLLMTLHMLQVFLWGAYKYPRELTWIVGVLLFLCTLGMAFTGQILRWDQDAYWGLGIGASIAARAPVIGSAIVDVLLGGPIIGGRTLSRFFAIHVFLIPGILIGLIGLHLWLVLRLGVNEWPMPGRLVDRETYRKRYEDDVHRDGVPFFPVAARKDMVGMGVVVLAVLVCAAVFGPNGPHGVPDPTITDAAPRPDFYFLALFALFALLPPWTETVILLVGPLLAIAFLLALPLIAGTGEKSWRRRPVAVLSVLLIVLSVTTLAALGVMSPWSPVMDAGTALATPVAYVQGRTPLELQGALVLQDKQCRNCHSLGGEGGRRGPALDGVATRLTQDRLIRQVLQGGGNMPAYGKNLAPAEVNALVAFLETLHPANQPPVRAATRAPGPIAGPKLFAGD